MHLSSALHQTTEISSLKLSQSSLAITTLKESHSSQVSSLNNQLHSSTLKTQELNAKLSYYDQQNSQLKGDIAQLKSISYSKEAELREKLRTSDATISTHLRSIKDLEILLESNSKMVSDLTLEISQLKSSNSKSNYFEEFIEIRVKKEEIESKLRYEEKRSEELTQNILKLEEKNEDMETKIRRLEEELRVERQGYEGLEEEIEGLESGLERLEKEMGEAKEELRRERAVRREMEVKLESVKHGSMVDTTNYTTVDSRGKSNLLMANATFKESSQISTSLNKLTVLLYDLFKKYNDCYDGEIDEIALKNDDSIESIFQDL